MNLPDSQELEPGGQIRESEEEAFTAYSVERLETYKSHQDITSGVDAAVVERTLKDLRVKGGRILDLCSGLGYAQELLPDRIKRRSSLTALDLSPAALAVQSLSPDKTDRLVVAKAQEIPVPDRTFDLVFSISGFDCIEGEGREGLAEEVARVLKPGGTFLSMRGNPYHIYDFAKTKLREFKNRGEENVYVLPGKSAHGDYDRLFLVPGRTLQNPANYNLSQAFSFLGKLSPDQMISMYRDENLAHSWMYEIAVVLDELAKQLKGKHGISIATCPPLSSVIHLMYEDELSGAGLKVERVLRQGQVNIPAPQPDVESVHYDTLAQLIYKPGENNGTVPMSYRRYLITAKK